MSVSWTYGKCVAMRISNAYTVEQRWSKQLLSVTITEITQQMQVKHLRQLSIPKGWDISQARELLTHFTYLLWSNMRYPSWGRKRVPNASFVFLESRGGFDGEVDEVVFWLCNHVLPSIKFKKLKVLAVKHHVWSFEAMLLNIRVEWKIIQLIDTLGGFVDDR